MRKRVRDVEDIEGEFNMQHQRFLDLGYPEAAGMSEDVFSGCILPLKSNLDKIPEYIPEGNISFLIVIPANIVPTHKQMSLVKLCGKSGFSNFDFRKLAKLKNDIIEARIPYLIYNIENGAGMRGELPFNCIGRFAENKRRGLFDIEGIALIAQYPKILQDHYIDLIGSPCGSESISHLCLIDDRPWLCCHWMWNFVPGYSHDWGTPSCNIDNLI